MFKPVPTRVDYVELEHDVQAWWDENQVLQQYLRRNQHSDQRWSFIDGPITANNPMGVHHAWGRSYKDLYNRFWTLRGRKLRYQNGFDCQGLWIEVEVEKELGFNNKHDIEDYGVARFVEACKERVRRFSGIQTEQSKRLGYWMDWDNSYFTNSDENNYTIWGFLKKCWQKGWIYKGKDTMPWCPRCGTGISQHEIVTEGYQELTHKSVFLKFPLTGRVEDGQSDNPARGQSGTGATRPEVEAARRPLDGLDAASRSGSAEGEAPLPGGVGGVPPISQDSVAEQRASDAQPFTPGPNESLLVWTTTPWTLVANVGAAVNPELTYLKVKQGDDVLYVSQGALANAVQGEHEVIGEVKGSELIGLTYRGPFDEMPVQEGVIHQVIRWDEVSDAEGTGIVHIAPGAGAEDFALGKEYGLEAIAPLEEDGTYIVGGGFGFLEGRFAGDVPEDVFASLRDKGVLYRVLDYTHRYPTCWRCSSELVFRLVDEWFISMDELRFKIMDTTRKVRWIPEFGEAREIDWLRNMHDWMISKKRYYGLALPIFDCGACGHFEVIGSENELKERAVEGWDEFEGHSPHRPFVDAVKIACGNCGATVERIRDVGNPWLDAGIVPFSTLDYRHNPAYWQEWFPADWVSESFPGQFRNWFYALLTMGTVMVLDTDHEGEPPFKNLFSYAMLRDERGEEMHKSKGNAIWFEDAAERMSADVMRWMYMRANPANNLNFGWHGADELKRGFLSTLWNTYSFLVTYANIDGWTPASTADGAFGGHLSDLDRWVLSELNTLVGVVTNALENYDAMTACRQIEDFVEGLSNWYVRRSRRRFWKPALADDGAAADPDKEAAYQTLWTCLETLNRLMAPFMPFLAENVYRNLVSSWSTDAPASVHLADWPEVNHSLVDEQLQASVRLVQRVVSLGRAARSKANLRVRQPLAAVHVRVLNDREAHVLHELADQVTEELNVKALAAIGDDAEFFEYQVRPNLPVLGPKYGGEVGRIQRALATADKGEIARAVGRGQNVTLDGIELEPSELLVSLTGKPGYAVAEEAGYAVAVTTEVTPELADEGLARELVRRIQEMRKNAGFEIADRIRLSFDGDADVARVMDSWGEYIRQETLSENIASGAGGSSPEGSGEPYREEHEIDGRKLALSVTRI